ncbi:MAG: prenyltransferase [Candidatus Omnitrophica bacterium]|jgi:1,4-dihydroxy-2-naphthoate octaprenyltransferase|nr:prenyltransferase [Candidatus Omnitrophota bacterium]MDD5661337.1 prenyltransferase [Candidatus Omnitrophota bacterium]
MVLKDWLLLSRIPFLTVMVLPYILGALLANRISGNFNLPVFLFGLWGAVLVQLVSHYSGEVYDIAEDRLSITLEKNFFSGGSQVVVENRIPQRNVKILIGSVVLLALAIGCMLQFYFKTGKWTLLLGISGIICGLFYSKPPLRWVARGWGELLIAYAFGWLAVNVGFYIQTAHFDIFATLVSLPISCAVVNIILINEYPDYPADKLTAKENLLVRIGKEKGALLYAVLVMFTAVTFSLVVINGLHLISAVIYLPVLVISVILAGRMLKGVYNDRCRLEKMCMMTILVSLGTSLSCILGVLMK